MLTMATNFSPTYGSDVSNQFPSIVTFGMMGFYVSASGAIQGHNGPVVYNRVVVDISVIVTTLTISDLTGERVSMEQRQLLKKTYWEEEKMLNTNIFSSTGCRPASLCHGPLCVIASIRASMR